ncbi:hypothetical protein AVEN_132687-1 [Araneus ventricosus]|uniref:Retrovirus-related Pol polyprotein from transposon TNT 1-94-like beta-barrel domain-containing protein n=1 Tax=Araneus ventricosus TaxID=182803 RepID=A0A4Y2AWA3_ARAVE|nr:hypothetical protein AVEN_132687-1 [Araneus ventricosus]
MPDTRDVRDHLRKFFDIVDKLSEMEINIDVDLLSIILLYSLPASYESFRCAIESHDDLPSADVLRIKIIEESEARRHDSGARFADSGALTASHHKRKNASWKSKSKPQKEVDNKFKIKCFKCNKWGDHKAAQSKSQRQSTPGLKEENAGLLTSNKWNNNTADALLASNKEKRWCLDSECIQHLSSDESIIVTLGETDISEVTLANNGTTEVKGCGKAVIKAEENNNIQTVDLNDALFVPELRTNLLSVAKLYDRGYTVTFKSDVATLINAKAKVKLVADRKDNLYYLREDMAAGVLTKALPSPKHYKCLEALGIENTDKYFSNNLGFSGCDAKDKLQVRLGAYVLVNDFGDNRSKSHYQ